MQDRVQKLIFSSTVFIIGISIGTIYAPEVITFSKNMEDSNLEKQQQQNKSNPLNLKAKKKNQRKSG